jgi:hypothetical protein
MSDEYESTQIGYSLCDFSPVLNSVLNRSPSLSLDIHIARQAVSSGSSIEQAIELIRVNGPITTTRDSLSDNESIVEALKSCLGSIASGKCLQYPKN